MYLLSALPCRDLRGQIPSPLSALHYDSALAEEPIYESVDVSRQSQSSPLQQHGKIKGGIWTSSSRCLIKKHLQVLTHLPSITIATTEDWDTPGTGPTRVTAASFHPSLLPYGQALMNAPAAWLSNLDFKTMSVPSMSSFSADNLPGFGRQGETVGYALSYVLLHYMYYIALD